MFYISNLISILKFKFDCSSNIFAIRMLIGYMNMSYLCRPACPQSKMSNIPAIYGRAGLSIDEPFAPNSIFLLSLYLSLSLYISLSPFFLISSFFSPLWIFNSACLHRLPLCSCLYIFSVFQFPLLTSRLLRDDSMLNHKTMLSLNIKISAFLCHQRNILIGLSTIKLSPTSQTAVWVGKKGVNFVFTVYESTDIHKTWL